MSPLHSGSFSPVSQTCGRLPSIYKTRIICFIYLFYDERVKEGRGRENILLYYSSSDQSLAKIDYGPIGKRDLLQRQKRPITEPRQNRLWAYRLRLGSEPSRLEISVDGSCA